MFATEWMSGCSQTVLIGSCGCMIYGRHGTVWLKFTRLVTRWHSTDRQEKRKRRGEGERGGERATDRQTEREMGDGVVFL